MSADRERLERICKDRNAPQQPVWRTEIVLLSADGVGTSEIMRRTGTSKTCGWRWQERFMQEGVEGLLRDKTRPSRIPALTPELVAWVATRTREPPPGETTHWTASLMAREAGISASSVHRIWRAHGLQPHRVRQFKLSNDPEFIDKLRDVVGLYVAPPAHAIVLSFDEKSQIQALDRAQCRRGFLRQADQPPPQTWRLPFARRPSGRHQPLPCRAQRKPKALRLDRRSRQNYRRRQTRAPSVRVEPLGGF